MNHLYRTVWNEITRTFVAVAENVKRRGKRSSGSCTATAGSETGTPAHRPGTRRTLVTSRPQMLVLEPRLVFDGAAVESALVLESAEPVAINAPDGATADDTTAVPPAVPAAGNGERKEIVVIDTRAVAPETLLQGLDDNIEVILLQGDDGLDELADALAGRSGIDALHIISHGSAGHLQLGGETLDDAALAAQQDTLARIGAALNENADLLLYGCAVGAGETGQAFIEQLALATGADVAASDDATGAAVQGGDWEVEIAHGDIDAALPLSAAALKNFNGLLALPVGPIRPETFTINSPTSRTSTDGYFVVTSPSAISNVVDYASVPFAVKNSDTTDGASSSFSATVNGGLGSFELTALSVAEDGDAPTWDSMTLTGYLLGGGIVSGTITDDVYGDNHNVDVTNFSGKQITGFKIDFDAGVGYSPKNFWFYYFTVANAQAANAAPTITNLGGDSLSYSEGAGVLVIDQGNAASVTDADSANFDSGTLTVSIASGGDSAEDVLAIRNQGTGAGQIGVSGSNVTYAGTTIGTFTGGSGGSNLVVTLNTSSSPTAAGALLQNITYQNTDTTAPTTGNRTVNFVITDGDGGTSGTTATTVAVSTVNDAPTLTATASSPTYTENASAADLFSSVSIGTIESGQTITELKLTVSNLADSSNEKLTVDGSEFSLINGTTGTSSGGKSVTYSVSVTGSTATVTLTKNGGGGYSTTDAQTIVDGLAYRNASEAPTTASNRVVMLTSVKDDGGTANSGQDTTTLSVASTVTVAAVNDAPTLTGAPSDVTVTEDVASNLDLSAVSVPDNEGNNLTVTLVVSAGSFSTPADGAAVGSGVTETLVNATTITLAGSAADINTYLDTASNIKYTGASNASGNNAATLTLTPNDGTSNGTAATVNIDIAAVNDAPTATAVSVAYTNTSATDTFANSTGSITATDVDSTVIKAPLGYWKFDEGTGTTTLDSSGNNLTGTFRTPNPTWSTDVPTGTSDWNPNSLDFTGLKDGVQVAWPTSLNIVGNSPRSFSLWYKPTANGETASSNYDRIISWSNDAFEIAGTLGNTAVHRLAFYDGSWRDTGFNMAVGTWYQITFTYDGSNVKLFISGVEKFSGTSGGRSLSGTMYIGLRHTGDEGVNGLIDDLRMYDVALSSAQINALTAGESGTLNYGVASGSTTNGTSTRAGNYGSLSVNTTTGAYTYVPDSTKINALTANATDTFTVNVTDSKGAATSTSFTVNLTTSNDIPVNTVPAAQTFNEDGTLTFSTGNGNALSVADADTGTTLTTLVSVESGKGTLAVTTGGGATITGNASNSVQIVGTVAQVQNALGSVAYTPTANSFGAGYATLTLASTDNGAGTLNDTDTVTINITAVADTPAVTNASTTPSTQTTSGLVLSRNAADGAEVTHFKITGISNGTLYQNDGTTPINNNDFITFAQGNAGLKFTPAGTTDGSFTAQASTSNTDGGLGGATVTATATVILPIITSNGGGATAAVNVAENTTAITTVIATDPDQTLTYSISGGADQARFAINATTGALSFASAPNFEVPTDADTNNSYVVAVTASDGKGGTDVQTITISVTDVNEAPSITSGATGTLAENAAAGTTVYVATATDPDGTAPNKTLTYSLSGTDATAFTINATTGVVTNNATANFEIKSSYGITVIATDAGTGALFDSKAVTINVTDVYEAPSLPPQTPAAEPVTLPTTVVDTTSQTPQLASTPTVAPPVVASEFSLAQVTSSAASPTPGTTASTSPSGPPTSPSAPPATQTEANSFTRADGFQIAVRPASTGGESGLVVSGKAPDQFIDRATGGFEVAIPRNLFSHTDPNASITLTVSRDNGQALPVWMRFDPVRGVFTGEPPPNFAGEVAIRVIARDSEGREVVTTFRIKVGAGGAAETAPQRPLSGKQSLSEQLAAARFGLKPGANDPLIRHARVVTSHRA